MNICGDEPVPTNPGGGTFSMYVITGYPFMHSLSFFSGPPPPPAPRVNHQRELARKAERKWWIQ